MRLARVWLVYAVTGGLAVAGAAVSATELALRCAAVAFGVLAWHVAAGARATAPHLRWPLTAGCVLFAAAALVRQSARTDRPDDVGWFAYGPPDTANLVALRDAVCRLLGWELRTAGVQLGAVVLFAGAVYGLPLARSRSRLVATAVAALVLAAGIVADRWFGIGVGADRLGVAVGGVWPGLLVAVAGLAGLVLAGRRADHRWLVAVGAALVAVQAAVSLSDLTGLWLSAAAITELLVADQDRAIAVGTAVSEGAALDVGQALTTAVALCGPALVVAGVLRSGTPRQDDRSGPQED